MRYLFCLCVLLASSLWIRGEDVLRDLRAGHPRLLLTTESIAAMRAAEKTDPLRAQPHRHLIAAAYDFATLVDPVPLWQEREMAYVSRWANAVINQYCLRYNFAPKPEWPWLAEAKP